VLSLPPRVRLPRRQLQLLQQRGLLAIQDSANAEKIENINSNSLNSNSFSTFVDFQLPDDRSSETLLSQMPQPPRTALPAVPAGGQAGAAPRRRVSWQARQARVRCAVPPPSQYRHQPQTQKYENAPCGAHTAAIYIYIYIYIYLLAPCGAHTAAPNNTKPQHKSTHILFVSSRIHKKLQHKSTHIIFVSSRIQTKLQHKSTHIIFVSSRIQKNYNTNRLTLFS
jgi:hypothetical protein